MATAPVLTATPSGDALELRPAGSWTAANAATLERLSNGVAPQLDRPTAVKLDMAGVRELDTLGAWLLEKMSRRAASGRPPRRCRRCRRQLCRPDRGGSSGQSAQRRRRRRRTIPSWPSSSDIGRSTIGASEDVTAFLQMLGALLHRHSGRAAPAAIAAADVAGLSALPRRLAGDPDHGADHLPDRRHHRAAGHLPFPQVRRRLLRRRHGRHSGAARTRRADRRHHGRRPLRQRLHRRTRLDEDARGDRRAVDHGARSGRGADPAARSSRWSSRCRS